MFLHQNLSAAYLDIAEARLRDDPASDHMEIVDDRCGSRGTIITSQLPVDHWHAWISDAAIADAMLDRPLQLSHRMVLKADSLRARRITSERTISHTHDPTDAPRVITIPECPVTIAWNTQWCHRFWRMDDEWLDGGLLRWMAVSRPEPDAILLPPKY